MLLGRDPVAVAIATTPEAALAALPLIDVEYEPLPAILHPRDAVQDGAPLIHKNLAEYHRDTAIHVASDSNICHHYQLRRGDVVSAFAEAYLIVENEYWVPWIAHVQLEPHGVAVLWDGNTFTIWSSSQSPFFIRETIYLDLI